ncbi:hypothetical protein [Marinoscillum pacificum]|uniref:hypothetical protein n=1 Tax=Marinoscillum pacificum TaxID=392723 RepID=UPI0021589B90|nr:hypothetical protein [Marinoscillum pacificum]|tara:strand:+ start:113 stop:394 length:282 start_codon:yes stop_codon:yes gene_type:complete
MSITFTPKMKLKSQTRMWVKWKYLINGYPDMIYWSFETEKSVRSRDLTYGMKKLISLARSSHLVGKYEVAIIYNTQTDLPLMKFVDGKEVTID